MPAEIEPRDQPAGSLSGTSGRSYFRVLHKYLLLPLELRGIFAELLMLLGKLPAAERSSGHV